MPNKSGNLFIVSAPSGAGKTSLVRELVDQTAEVKASVSYTTRAPRDGEEEGFAYHFVNTTAFADMIMQGLFIEYATVFDHYYGTSRAWVEDQLADGVNVILDIDWQGARQIKSELPDALSIFILPPTYDTLQQRLIQRNDSTATIRRRMRDARDEISHYSECDFVVINNDFQQALSELKAIIRFTKPEGHHQPACFKHFVKDLLADNG